MTFEPDPEATYSLESIARLTGFSTQTILRFAREGLIQGETSFDDEALRTLRRMEQLREHYDVDDAALNLMIHLMDEVDRLQRLLRSRR